MRLFILSFLVTFALGSIAHADTVQWSKGFTGNCDNPTERIDETPLAVTEILRIEYYVDPVDGNITNPDLTYIMAGGCQPMFIDTKLVPPGDYYVYGRTFTTDGLDSVASSPGTLKTFQKARPKAGSNFR